MSVIVMEIVWQANLPPNEKLILLAYADHADQHGRESYPSIQTVARKTGYKTRTVQYKTRKLTRRGLLLPDGKGPQGTNRWRIPLEGLRGCRRVHPNRPLNHPKRL